MNFMKFLVFGFLVLAIAQIAHADVTAQQTRCEVKDSKSVVSLVPVSKEESYMQEAKFKGFDITTLDNEDGISYTVSVAKNGKLVVETDVVMYPDTALKFANGKDIIEVSCQRP